MPTITSLSHAQHEATALDFMDVLSAVLEEKTVFGGVVRDVIVPVIRTAAAELSMEGVRKVIELSGSIRLSNIDVLAQCTDRAGFADEYEQCVNMALRHGYSVKRAAPRPLLESFGGMNIQCTRCVGDVHYLRTEYTDEEKQYIEEFYEEQGAVFDAATLTVDIEGDVIEHDIDVVAPKVWVRRFTCYGSDSPAGVEVNVYWFRKAPECFDFDVNRCTYCLSEGFGVLLTAAEVAHGESELWTRVFIMNVMQMIAERRCVINEQMLFADTGMARYEFMESIGFCQMYSSPAEGFMNVYSGVDKSDRICLICREALCDGTVSYSVCGHRHLVHPACYAKWVDGSGMRTCVACKGGHFKY